LIATGLFFGVAMGSSSVARAAPADAQLAKAIHMFEQLDDEGSTLALRALVASNPPSEVAAKAHIFLGLIAFNAFRADEAREEFKKALRLNAAIELPRRVSPKAKLGFAQARQELSQEVENSAAPLAPAPPLATAAPAPAPAPAPMVLTSNSTESVEPSHSHVLSFVLGGGAVVAAGLAIFGGVEVAQDVSLVNSANANPGKYTSSQLDSAHSNAAPWAAGWIICAAVAAVAGTAAVITF
jgi:tetratricopeptide (TPR) repeat protein